MPSSFTNRQNILVIVLTLVLGGCASEPVAVSSPMLSGEKMLSESKDIATLGDRWKKGKQLIDNGNILIREGRNKIDEGNEMISEGQKIQLESEQSYKDIK